MVILLLPLPFPQQKDRRRFVGSTLISRQNLVPFRDAPKVETFYTSNCTQGNGNLHFILNVNHSIDHFRISMFI